VLDGPGARFGYRFGKTGCAPFRNKNAVESGTFCCSQHRAKIVGVFDAVEHHEEC
jgi:hypothetical protein